MGDEYVHYGAGVSCGFRVLRAVAADRRPALEVSYRSWFDEEEHPDVLGTFKLGPQAAEGTFWVYVDDDVSELADGFRRLADALEADAALRETQARLAAFREGSEV